MASLVESELLLVHRMLTSFRGAWTMKGRIILERCPTTFLKLKAVISKLRLSGLFCLFASMATAKSMRKLGYGADGEMLQRFC